MEVALNATQHFLQNSSPQSKIRADLLFSGAARSGAAAFWGYKCSGAAMKPKRRSRYELCRLTEKNY